MDAGRELDALVAEKVMGWEVDRSANRLIWLFVAPNGKRGDITICPPYSTDIAAAWQVVERMNSDWSGVGYRFASGFHFYLDMERPNNLNSLSFSSAADAARLICLAALKAVEG